jgi:pyruvate/2-oxoglutarate dehydrogenase complex dihydrolipoamide dehydrogenase (E3) component
LELVADAATGVLIGASAIGPEADSWAGELALAVRLGVTVHELADHVHAFPTWSEAIGAAARDLAGRAHD